ncbi:unnamed protein product, partial [Citrullus colocynthis]
ITNPYLRLGIPATFSVNDGGKQLETATANDQRGLTSVISGNELCGERNGKANHENRLGSGLEVNGEDEQTPMVNEWWSVATRAAEEMLNGVASALGHGRTK